MKRSRQGMRGWGAASIVALVLLALGLAGPVLSGGNADTDGSVPTLPDANLQLAEAQAQSPFKILLPGTLPDGYELARVDWLADVATFNVDLWWDKSGSSSFHIWESNIPASAFDNPDQGRDPTVSDQYVDVGGVNWAVTKGDWGETTFAEICNRNDAQISVCVGSIEGLNFVEQVAATLS